MSRAEPYYPYVEEMEGDTLTPISVFQNLTGKKKCLLESSDKHHESGRFSFITANPYLELKSYGENHFIYENEAVVRKIKGKTVDVLKELIPKVKGLDEFPFIGGGIGYIGYDVIRQYESIGEVKKDSLELPDSHVMLYQDVCIFDHIQQRLYLLAVSDKNLDDAKRRVKSTRRCLENITHSSSKAPFYTSDFQSNQTHSDFIVNVNKAKDLIKTGEIFQVVLSQRFQSSFEGDPFTYYRQLRRSNPSPYMFYMDFSDYIVMGASPESLVKVTGKEVTTNPIAGTRPRGSVQEEDDALAAELLSDEKERAEHDMLVDLSRNDIGRIAQVGSVVVPKYMEVEKYQHVMHLVSEVKGILRDDVHPLDAVTVTIPAGTVSGAPKIRAMTILNDLEQEKRSVYSGAVGYVSYNGQLDFALAIRTMVIKNNIAFVQAGAGIVYDSEPEKEFVETLNKARSLLEVEL